MTKIAKRYASRFQFSFYTREDMEQEAFIIAMDGFTRWDGERPLENFLARHVYNRLVNFRRDKYDRTDSSKSEQAQKTSATKKDIMCPAELQPDDILYSDDVLSQLVNEEMMEILSELPMHIYNDLQRMANGTTISISRRRTVIEHVKKKLGEDYEEEEG